MCLSTVTRVFSEPSSEVRRGWKAFKKYKTEGIVFPYFTVDGRFNSTPTAAKVETNKWLTAQTQPTCADNGDLYEIGFHIFENRLDAETWGLSHCDYPPFSTSVIREVEATEITSEGMQGLEVPRATFVARKMKVLA